MASSDDQTQTQKSAKRIGLHPLAIASICDHYTRTSMGGTKFAPTDPAIGFLFGVQNGLEISIIDATEAVYEMVNGRAVLNAAKVLEKRELWTKVYANHELLGWYTVGGTEPEPWCVALHREIMELNEAPLFLLMNRAPDPNGKQLPLTIYEMESTTSTHIFGGVSFHLETTQVERIAVDQITKVVPTDGVSTLEVLNQTVVTSLRTLEEKIDVLVASLQNIQKQGGPIEPSEYEILRRAAKICQQLPAIDSRNFHTSFSNEITDCMMVSYLGASTKTLASLSELTELMNQCYTTDRVRRARHY